MFYERCRSSVRRVGYNSAIAAAKTIYANSEEINVVLYIASVYAESITL